MPCLFIMASKLCSFDEMRFSKRVGLVIRELRLEKGWSQQQLAERMDYERSRIGRLELGQTAITVDILLDAANALQVDLHALLPVEVRLKKEVVTQQRILCPSPDRFPITTPNRSNPSVLL